VHELGPADRDAVAALYSGLSPRDNYLRFFGPRPAHLDRYLDRLCHPTADRFALGAFRGRTLVGVIGCTSTDSDGAHSSAEVALVVDEHERRHGVATELLCRALDVAAARGITRIDAEVLAENTMMLRVLREDGRAHLVFDGPIVDVDIAAATPVTDDDGDSTGTSPGSSPSTALS